jgi:hypothetical protein
VHSPKFEAKSKSLAATINPATLLQSWKKKVRDDLRRQVIPDPVEYLDFHVMAADGCQAIAKEIQSGSYAPSHVTRVTSEKSKGLCRLIVIPNMRDALVLQVLADSLWSEIRNKAPTNKSFYAPKDHAFIQMQHGLEDEYGPIAQWIKFQKEILGFSQRKPFIVVTDIANYYDWIRYTGMRSILSELISTKEIVLDILIFVLRSMIWRPDYMANHDVGLPQCDFDAPRMLAHTFLFEIDGLLRDYPGVEFARYMDDIDIGVNTYSDAKKVLRDLDLTLQSRHLRLNSGKTLILTSSEAEHHFCVKENDILNHFDARMSLYKKSLKFSKLPNRFLPWLTRKCLISNRFSQGNGQKILKRIVNYSRLYDVEIDKDLFLSAFLNWPGTRESLLRYIGSKTNPFKYIDILGDALHSGQIVDDITPVQIAVAINSARYTKKIPAECISKILDNLDSNRPFHVFSKLWIISRFSDYQHLRREIDQTSQTWSKEPIIIRSISGFLPIFRGTQAITPFMARLIKLGGRTSTDIFDFYSNRIFEKKGFSSVQKFIGAENKSSANGITHSKF